MPTPRRVPVLARAGAGALLALVLLALLPAAASAGPLKLPLKVPPLLGGGAQVDPYALFDHELLDPIAATACPATKPLVEVLPGGLGRTAEGLVCALGVLDYQFETRFRRPDGTQRVKRTTALLMVPQVLDVDDDPLPDLVGWIGITGANRFELRVRRVLGEQANLPVSVEAQIDDPTRGGLPRTNIVHGFDARAGRAPASVTSTIEVPVFGGTPADGSLPVSIDVQQQGAGGPLAVTGGLVDLGPGGQRSDPLGGRLRYDTPPATVGIDLSIGDALELDLHTSSATRVVGQVENVRGASDQRADVRLEDLEGTLHVDYAQPGQDRRVAHYVAATPIDEISVRYSDRNAGVLEQRAVVRATEVPRRFEVEQEAATTAELRVLDGARIGSLEVGLADGEPALLATDDAYVRVLEEAGLSSYAAKVTDLARARIAADGAEVRVEADLQPDGPNPFRALVDQPGRHVDAEATNLAADTDLRIDTGEAGVHYDGSDPIDRIDVAVDGDALLEDAGDASGVRHLRGRIDDLPEHVDVTAGASNGAAFDLHAVPSVGRSELEVWTTQQRSLPAGRNGVRVHRVPGEFAAHARVHHLRAVRVEDAPMRVVTQFAGQQPATALPFVGRLTEPARDTRAALSEVPLTTDVRIDPAELGVHYAGSGTITRLEAEVDAPGGLKPPAGQPAEGLELARHARAVVEDVPTTMDFVFSEASKAVSLKTGQPIGSVDLSVWGDQAAPLPGDGAGVAVRMPAGDFAVRARVLGLQELQVAPDPLEVVTRFAAAQKFDVDVVADLGAGPLTTVDGVIDAVPGEVTITSGQELIEYEASDEIELVSLEARNLPGEDGDARNISAVLEDVPVEVGIWTGALQKTGIQTGGGSLGSARLAIWDDGSPIVGLPADRNTVRVDSGDGQEPELAVGVRVADVRAALLEASTAVAGKQFVSTHFGSQPLPLDVVLEGETDVELHVPTLPQKFDGYVQFGDEQKVSYTASSPIGELQAIWKLWDMEGDLELEDLPAKLDACIASATTGCGGTQMPETFNVDGDYVTIPHRLTVDVDTFGAAEQDDIEVDLELCQTPKQQEGHSEFLDARGCLDAYQDWRKKVTISALEIAGDVRFEVASGNTNQKDADGDPLEDNLIKFFLDTDGKPLKLNGLHMSDHGLDADGALVPGSTNIYERWEPALWAQDKWLALDTDVPVSVEDEGGSWACETVRIQAETPVGLQDVVPLIPICTSPPSA